MSKAQFLIDQILLEGTESDELFLFINNEYDLYRALKDAKNFPKSKAKSEVSNLIDRAVARHEKKFGSNVFSKKDKQKVLQDILGESNV